FNTFNSALHGNFLTHVDYLSGTFTLDYVVEYHAGGCGARNNIRDIPVAVDAHFTRFRTWRRSHLVFPPNQTQPCVISLCRHGNTTDDWLDGNPATLGCLRW